jgi:hypothetical protein
MDTTADRRLEKSSWRKRLGALGVLATLILAAASTLSPAQANAAPASGGVRGDGFCCVFTRIQYTLVSAVPTFDVADARVVDNGLDAPINVTLTSQQSQTFTVQVVVGTERNFNDFLKASVSTTIVMTRVTSIGISIETQVPAHSRLVGRYGVEAFDVTYDASTTRCANSICGTPTVQRLTTNVPTLVEGWHLAPS